MANYNSAFTGTHNDEYDSRITALNDTIATKVSKSGDTITGQLYINKTNDIGGTGAPGTTAPFVIGVKDEQHLEFDSNEILAKTDGTTPGTLYLQDSTGTVAVCGTGGLSVTAGLVRITNNSNTVTIGSQNTQYCHFINSASIPFYFNRHLSVDGNIYIYNNGPYSLQRGGISSGWVNGRDNVLLRQTAIAGYSPCISIKTLNGSWEIGAYNNNSYQNQLIFSYVTDTNYNSNNNTSVTARITPAGAFTNASKREFKENIRLIDYSCLDIINSIKICSFNMKGDEEKDYRVGFIADDTNPIVSGKNQDIMDLQNCIGVLIKAVQELSQKCDLLENKIKELSQ